MNNKNDIELLQKLELELNKFQNSYSKILKYSKQIENINILGSMPEYPFIDSMDLINFEKWISKFRNNINVILVEKLSNEKRLYNKKELKEILKISYSTLDKRLKKLIDYNDKESIYFIITKPQNSNGKKYLYTEALLEKLKIGKE